MSTDQSPGASGSRSSTAPVPSRTSPLGKLATGDRLLEAGDEAAYRDLLFPFALMVTSNLVEAALLVGAESCGVDDMEAVARELHGSGAGWVLVKGDHLMGDQAADVVFDG